MKCYLSNVSNVLYRFYVNEENEEEIEIIGNDDDTFTFDQKWDNNT